MLHKIKACLGHVVSRRRRLGRDKCSDQGRSDVRGVEAGGRLQPFAGHGLAKLARQPPVLDVLAAACGTERSMSLNSIEKITCTVGGPEGSD